MNKNALKYGMLAFMLLISIALLVSPAAADPVMTRTLSDSVIGPGDTVHVTLELTNYEGGELLNSLQEDYSAAPKDGWTVSNTVLPPELDAYVISAGVVHDFSRDLMSGVMEAGVYTVEYDLTVNAGTAPGVYDLTGRYIDTSNSAGYPAVGDTQLSIGNTPTEVFNGDVSLYSIEMNDAAALAATGLTFDATGGMLNSIDGHANSFGATAEESVGWSIWVNDALAGSGYGTNALNDGDVVEFVYTSYTGAMWEPNMLDQQQIVTINVNAAPTQELFNDEVLLAASNMNDSDALTATGLSFDSTGGFLNSIEGYANSFGATAEESIGWSIWVNDALAGSGYGTNALNDGDVLKFIYTSYTGAMWEPNMNDQRYVVEITAKNMPLYPDAEFSADVVSGDVPLTVQFTDESTDGVVTEWQWDFNNDGIIDSYEQNPVHTYTTEGFYSVSLVVLNLQGSTEELKANFITAGIPAPASGINAQRTIENDTIMTYDVPRDVFVSVTMTANEGDIGALTLQETIPEGWDLETINNDGAVFKANTLEWVWAGELVNGDSKTIEYVLHVPASCDNVARYDISGIVYAYEIAPITVIGETDIVITYDWNPWDDPDSEDNEDISTLELQNAIHCWITDELTPDTNEVVTTERLQYLIDCWLTDN
ncbi:DUF4430 domain-containing protein [Methanococcoides sp. SA1]|nr:DUF4430 domain-containing protein [Methanococcoides sp. SA1]